MIYDTSLLVYRHQFSETLSASIFKAVQGICREMKAAVSYVEKNYPEDGCSRRLRTFVAIYTASYPKRRNYSPVLLWET